MASVMLRSAFAPRKTGWSSTKPCGVWCPHPIVPAPGTRPSQFADRMKMNTVAKNQNVLLTRCGPMMLSRKSYRPATSHSRRFCAPVGTPFMSRVTKRLKTISPAATIQLTTIEFVMGKPKGRAISTACCGRPRSSDSAVAAGRLPRSAFPPSAISRADGGSTDSLPANARFAAPLVDRAARSRSTGAHTLRPGMFGTQRPAPLEHFPIFEASPAVAVAGT